MARKPITRANPRTFTRGRLKGQTVYTEHEYRKLLPSGKGKPKAIHTKGQLGRLRPVEREARERALNATAIGRKGEASSLRQAARKAHTTPQNVLKWAPHGWQRGKGGRYQVTERDRLYRPLEMLTTLGRRTLSIRDSQTASRIGRHWAAVERYRDTGDASRLREFRGRWVQSEKVKWVFMTDTHEIDRLAQAGELSFESIYSSAA